MSELTSLLYSATRKIGKAASTLNDVENIANGHADRVVKKAIKREMHKNLNSILRGTFKL